MLTGAPRRATALSLLAPLLLGAAARGRDVDRPQMVPILDGPKGARAAADYRASLDRFCRPSTHGGDAANPAPLRKAGLAPDASLARLCASADAARPLASGSVTAPGADEVLLEVASGRDVAAGERTLALMRGGNPGYRLARYLFSGAGFDVPARLSTPGHPDILMLCERGGNMGVYPTSCRFLGRGQFQPEPSESATRAGSEDELRLIRITACGPGASVTLGKISQRNRTLLVELIVEKFVLEPAAPDEVADGPYCTGKRVEAANRFVVKYELAATGVHRSTPIPPEAEAVLARY
jgi:hypothetical protein